MEEVFASVYSGEMGAQEPANSSAVGSEGGV
jgi:hypothetical protein